MQRTPSEERAFYTTLLHLALPIATQQLVMNGLNAVDVLMIGQLGAPSVAAVGLANQIYFLLTMLLFGVGSGVAIYAAQYWGAKDVPGLRRVLGIGLRLALIGSALFCVAALALPERLLSFYSRDPAVIGLGGPYLRTVCLCYIPVAITSTYALVLRSTRHVKTPMVVAIAALTLKTGLAYVLIFGKLGVPPMGIMGAATATVVARVLECAALLLMTYRHKLPAAATLSEMALPDRPFLARFARTTLPVILGEIIWSLGITTYNAVYARISTESLAAVNIASTLDGVAIVPFLGLGSACAIMLGNEIGAGNSGHALADAKRFLRLTLAVAAAVGLIVFGLSWVLPGLYQISPTAQENTRRVLTVMALALSLKAANIVTIVGILRSGGDTRFAFFADIGPMWVIGVPTALLAGLVLHLPIYWVVLLILFGDEATKAVISLRRVMSGRWIHQVAWIA